MKILGPFLENIFFFHSLWSKFVHFWPFLNIKIAGNSKSGLKIVVLWITLEVESFCCKVQEVSAHSVATTKFHFFPPVANPIWRRRFLCPKKCSSLDQRSRINLFLAGEQGQRGVSPAQRPSDLADRQLSPPPPPESLARFSGFNQFPCSLCEIDLDKSTTKLYSHNLPKTQTDKRTDKPT